MELTQDLLALQDLVRDLFRRVEGLETENAALRAENAALVAEVANLRSRLGLNSKNSNKPPSSDGLTKKPGLPKASPKKSGGQFGHPGNTLQMVDTPDKVIIHHAPCCSCCGKTFSALDVVAVGAQKRQVFDIPPPRLEVTEHQLGMVVCCGKQHQGVFPPQVSQPVQYGSRSKALSVMLNNQYKLPLNKIKQLFGDLWACSFNPSTVLRANAAMYEALEGVEAQIKTAVLSAPIAHFDETGMRVEKKLHWFHVASTNLLTYLFVHQHRGKQALQSDASLLPHFGNRAVHDCWATYFDFQQCSHALCGAHLLRELTYLIEHGSQWAADMHTFILELYQRSRKTPIPTIEQATCISQFRRICQMGEQEEPPPIPAPRGKAKNSKGRNLLHRLLKHQQQWLAFAFVIDVPFSNNQAERDIRCLKTKQKVATNFQTFQGAKHYARIQSVISTCRKHSRNVFQHLVYALDKKNSRFTFINP